MNQDAMIDEIVARVAAKLAALKEAKAPENRRERQPGLLVLAQGKPRLDLLRSEKIAEYFYTAAAPRAEHPANMDTVQAVVLYDLSIGKLAKIAEGRCDTPYTSLAVRSILLGKRMYAPKEFIELSRFAETAPKPYFAMLEEKLNLLKASGLTVCPEAELEERILSDHLAGGGKPFPVCPCVPEPEPESPAAAPPAAEPPCPCAKPETVVEVTKRVLTERDVSEAAAKKATAIRVGEKCIVTDLAREAAARRDIPIVREGTA